MTTLHITNAYHPTSGGIRTWYRQLMDRANAEGRRMRLVVPGDATRVEEAGAHGRIHHVQAPHVPVFDRRYRVLLPHRYLLPRAALLRILREEQPDVVEIADKYTLPWLAGLVRKGLVAGLRRPVLVGLSFERMDDNVSAWVTGHPLARALARRYMGSLYFPVFDFHMAASEYVAAELRDAVPAREHDRIVVQPGGFESQHFAPERRSPAVRQRMLAVTGGGPDTTLLLYAGRVSHEKNVPLLVDLIATLGSDSDADYRLLVVGDGPLAAWLERETATRAPGRVARWAHLRARDDLAAVYASCDVFVHPNPREPFGIAPLEAMASGCAVVLPDRGGVLTYANDRNAWLAPPDAASMAAAVRRLTADPLARAQRVQAARETAAAYDGQRTSTAQLARYDELLARFTGSDGSRSVRTP
jgi:alpha-1,6-mannosyltransferase